MSSQLIRDHQPRAEGDREMRRDSNYNYSSSSSCSACSNFIVLVPYPAQGHVTPMLQLASALHHQGFHPIVVLPEFIHRRILSSSSSPASSCQTDLENHCSRHKKNNSYNDNTKTSSTSSTANFIISIPDGGLVDQNPDPNFFDISYAMENIMPLHLELLIHRLLGQQQEEENNCTINVNTGGRGGRLVCLVVDLLASWAIKVSDRCKVPVAGFWPAMLATYKLIAAIPDMIRNGHISQLGSPQHEGTMCCLQAAAADHHDGQGQPSSMSLMMNTEHLPWLIGDSASQKSRFNFWLTILDRSRHLQCLLVNSFVTGDVEDRGLSSSCSPPLVLQIGPTLSSSSSSRTTKSLSFWKEDQTCLDWLQCQKDHSVIYVSFGSWVGPIGDDKVAELALGLENTKRPFIWVLGSKWRDGLPVGYLERVQKQNQGKIVTWAPQKEVLKHPAVGCYLTHCGWNSTMEAIQCGKRLVCYPLAGDQFVNSTYIIDVWRIGVKLNKIHRNDVYECVERVMMSKEGVEMQRRVIKLKARLTGDEGCSRAKANLIAFVDQVRNVIN